MSQATKTNLGTMPGQGNAGIARLDPRERQEGERETAGHSSAAVATMTSQNIACQAFDITPRPSRAARTSRVALNAPTIQSKANTSAATASEVARCVTD